MGSEAWDRATTAFADREQGAAPMLRRITQREGLYHHLQDEPAQYGDDVAASVLVCSTFLALADAPDGQRCQCGRYQLVYTEEPVDE